jgi:hypothetical protein
MTSISPHTKINLSVEYKGYTIVLQYEMLSMKPVFMYYPTAEGEQHDANLDGEDYRYTGNCKWADSLEEAKDAISEKIMTSQPAYLVETTVKLGGFELKNITKFWWINDAIRFAALWNGTPLFQILNP